jgi:hypothetical protein
VPRSLISGGRRYCRVATVGAGPPPYRDSMRADEDDQAHPAMDARMADQLNVFPEPMPPAASQPSTDAGLHRTGMLLAAAIFPFVLLSADTIGWQKPAVLALLLLWPLFACVALRRRSWQLMAGGVLAAGLAIRVFGVAYGVRSSDTLEAVTGGIKMLLHGGEPYVWLNLPAPATNQVLVYPPFQLLLHLPGYLLGGYRGVMLTEVVAAGFIMLAMVYVARKFSVVAVMPAMAAYAALPELTHATFDGGNDTSAAAVLLLAILVWDWARRRGFRTRDVGLAALAAAAALGTKQDTVFAVILLVVATWRIAGRAIVLRYVSVIAAVLGILAAPFLLTTPVEFLRHLALTSANQPTISGWNLWVEAKFLGLYVPERAITAWLNLGVSVVGSAWASWRMFRAAHEPTLGDVVTGAALITVAVLLTARWTSISYFAFLAPFVLLLPALLLRPAGPDGAAATLGDEVKAGTAAAVTASA